ncbi:MAG: DNA-protecting protein DprA [Legionella sp.]|nr:DNA-protecting protein DprA [Legionella sp.]
MGNFIYFIALNKIPSIGPRTVMKLLQRWPSLEKMFQLSCEQLEKAGVPAKTAYLIKQFDWKTIETELAWQESAPNRYILTWEDARYPSLLKEIANPPIVLYAEGNIDAFLRPTLSIIGSRRPSMEGAEIAYRFALDLASNGLSIVSGLALGVDAKAHAGAVDAEGSTLAVLGSGIDCIYPRQHLALADRIREKGLILSEFPVKTSPKPRHFPYRNRIISGLSVAILVVEAAIKSGSLITARLALEHNRDVLAVPGSILNPQSQGCHYLVQEGAKLVTSSQEVLDELNLAHRCMHVSLPTQRLETAKAIQDPFKSTRVLASDREDLVKFIDFKLTTLDQMLEKSGLNLDTITSNLALLEIEGIVKAIPGGYVRCLL